MVAMLQMACSGELQRDPEQGTDAWQVTHKDMCSYSTLTAKGFPKKPQLLEILKKVTGSACPADAPSQCTKANA